MIYIRKHLSWLCAHKEGGDLGFEKAAQVPRHEQPPLMTPRALVYKDMWMQTFDHIEFARNIVILWKVNLHGVLRCEINTDGIQGGQGSYT